MRFGFELGLLTLCLMVASPSLAQMTMGPTEPQAKQTMTIVPPYRVDDKPDAGKLRKKAPDYVLSKKVIKKGKTVGSYKGKPYICANAACTVGRRVD